MNVELLPPDHLGWIVPEPFRRLSPNRYSARYRPGTIRPVELIVYHYTAGGFDPSLRWLTSPNSQASAHFIVRKNGELWQLVPLKERAWHAGGKSSRWRNQPLVNGRSIGVEIENWGPLKARSAPNGHGGYLTYKGTPFRGEIADLGERGVWDKYTEAQLKTLEVLTPAIIQSTPLAKLSEFKGPADGELVGHEHVDPKRKTDPGPAFPWDRILKTANAKSCG